MTVSDHITLWSAVFTGVSATLAALSIMFAIYSYRRGRDKETFVGFRLVLLELRDTVSTTDRYLSAEYFAELGHKVANRIRSLLAGDYTKDQVIQYLTDKKRHDLIAQAIYLGCLDSASIKYLNESAQRLDRMPFQFREQFPLVFEATRSLVFYISTLCRKVAGPKFLATIFAEADGMQEAINGKFLFNYQTALDCMVDLEIYISAVPKAVMKKQQPVFDHAENLLNILVSKFANMSDAELRQQSRSQRRMSARITRIHNETRIEDAFECLDMIRELFTHKEWDTVVEQKTKLLEKAHPSEEEDGV